MYGRSDPKRKTRTAAQVREEAHRRIQEDKEKRRSIIEKRRATISGPLPGDANKTNANKTEVEPPPVSPVPPLIDLDPETTTEPDNNMPGSNKKRRQLSRPSTTPGADGQGDQNNDDKAQDADDGANNPTGEGIDANLKGFLLSIKKDLMNVTQSSVGQLSKRVEENEKHIKEIKTAIEKKDEALDIKITKKIESAMANINGRPSASDVELGKRELAFHRCRRSLKLWPIAGDDLEDEVKVFLKNKLNFSHSRIETFGKIEVSAPPSKAARDRKEVVATFESREDRDTIKSNGIYLANQKECGMSIHVPGHLLDDYFALNSIGYSIKTNNSGTIKRAVKFDDSNMSVYLDIMIGGKWKRISPDEARKVMKSVPAVSASSSKQLSLEDLSNLVQGEAVAGLTAVAVPMDSE